MPEKAWKRTQRVHRKRLGLNPVDVGQQSREGGVDGENPWLAVESKERKTPIKWLVGGLARAVSYAGDSRMGIMIIHFLGQRHDEDLVVMRLVDFEEWFGPVDE